MIFVLLLKLTNEYASYVKISRLDPHPIMTLQCKIIKNGNKKNKKKSLS